MDSEDNAFQQAGSKAKFSKGSLCWLMFVLLINVAEIGIGIWGKGDCASNPIDVGIWLIVAGSVGIAFMLLMFFPKLEAAFGCCFALFSFSWFIVGAFCLFSDLGKSACVSTAVWYWALTFWIINAIMISISLFFLCCFVGAAALIGVVFAILASASTAEKETLV